jgi:hypothetical protein
MFCKKIDRFGFKGIHEYLIFNLLRQEIDTGKMMHALLKEAIAKNILILNTINFDFHDAGNQVTVALGSFSF